MKLRVFTVCLVDYPRIGLEYTCSGKRFMLYYDLTINEVMYSTLRDDYFYNYNERKELEITEKFIENFQYQELLENAHGYVLGISTHLTNRTECDIITISDNFGVYHV